MQYSNRQIDSQRGAVNAARATLSNAELDYRRKSELYAAGAVAKSQLDDATMALNVARANVETQQQLLDRLLAGTQDIGATDSLNLPTIAQERASAENIRNDIAAFEQVSLGGYIPSELNAAAYEFLSELRQVVPNEIEVKIRVEVGEPAEEILNAAQGDFDLIVMGNRGFGGFDSETLGTVAKFVQDNSTKPVIFAKGMPGDWDDDNNFVGGENKWK